MAAADVSGAGPVTAASPPAVEEEAPEPVPDAAGGGAGAAEAAEEEEEDDDEEEEEDEEARRANFLRDLLRSITPAAESYPVTVSQSSERQRLTEKGKWTDIKGLRLTVKPANEDDCILLVASGFVTPQIDQQESQWAIFCGGHELSPRFSTYSRQKLLSQAVCLPFLHQPGKRAEQEYKVAASLGSTGTSGLVSAERERKSLFALTCPAFQIAWVADDSTQNVEAGGWRDVEDFSEVVTTLPGDKVLCICSIRYSAQWSSEMNRGRFTMVRDTVGLDLQADRGLQSVRALAPGLKRSALMVTLDEPPPGPHLYRVRAALTVGEEQGAVLSITGDRQLTLLRLPGHLVNGPCRPDGTATIEEEAWSELPGLATSITLRKPRDKVLIVYHMDCHPQDYHYCASFSVFRRGPAGAAVNLGFSDQFGLAMVTSDYRASSEYPAGLLIDAPGGVGPWTYYLGAKVAGMGTSAEPPAMVTGFASSIFAVLLTTR